MPAKMTKSQLVNQIQLILIRQLKELNFVHLNKGQYTKSRENGGKHENIQSKQNKIFKKIKINNYPKIDR